MTTGMDLKLERVRARVTATDLARQMGVTSRRISNIESLAVVTDAAASRYRDALRQLTEAPENVA